MTQSALKLHNNRSVNEEQHLYARMQGTLHTWRQKQHYRIGELMVHFSAKSYDINPGDDVHESCTNPPEDVGRVTATCFHAIIGICFGLHCALQGKSTVSHTVDMNNNALRIMQRLTC